MITAAPPLLAIEGLRMRYPGGDEALRGVDLEVSEGEFVSVIGSSGAGKSTLIRCINGLVTATGGSCRLEGRQILGLSGRELRLLRRRIGMIFQAHALVDRLTVMENLLSGRLGYTGFWRSALRRFPPGDVAAAFQLLERVGLAGFHDRRADRLSGGQRQRVGIARALMQRPALLLVDEPTASLDPETARRVMTLLRELAREHGLSVLANLHDVGLARSFSDRIIGLRHGEVVFHGKPAELDDEALGVVYGTEAFSVA
ncbi:MAG: phosphonate ABC transporter ATP-binding protein [Puniceicoccaceae bacterium]|nr:MAG: phosphonate ABC transporter ATP-binding protein [Puniceicoccaceae bacterium]